MVVDGTYKDRKGGRVKRLQGYVRVHVIAGLSKTVSPTK